MNKLKLVIIWCLLLGAFSSCSDKDDPEPDAKIELDYQPTTQGSTWAYGGSSPYTVTATGKTKVINGKTFNEMETREGNETRLSYVHKENGVYTADGMEEAFAGVALVFLKDKVPVGESWTETVMMDGFETKMTFSIEAKDITKTVEGKTYQNVIHVRMNTAIVWMGMEVDLGAPFNYFWAKGVGLILTDAGTYGNYPLESHTIK
jgi:hypothetical protein